MMARFAGRRRGVASNGSLLADNIAKGIGGPAATDADRVTGVVVPIDGGFLAA